MPYYHDPKTQIVAYMPDEPQVLLKKGKNGAAGIWSVSTTIEFARADNYVSRKTKQWAYDLRSYPKDQYAECRDTREDAIRYFKMNHSPRMPVVDYETYEKFRILYERIADTNRPPEKK